ncbi:GxxExxY protein [Planctopirus hydrillae]|uniref:Fe3+ hydroxamate ABC transporter substrate-binding protein n=1 Tax=Planctopirus hydrillae TaxID=1841610 RepID=A0A1C3E8C0_9PLAN|nr:GxxExxY protein [Planctopirus hydrillae]ODA29476.1 Fe3+ hydroxamate ABC transporter substrate-binding protein [Planctopirus hydrillae]
MSPSIEELSKVTVDAAFHIHKELGPGLLESVYEVVLARKLLKLGHKVERQVGIKFEFEGIQFEEGFRVDLLINDCLVVELKSVECLAPIHHKQVLTYLRLMKQPLGLLINFGSVMFKDGVKRVVNNHVATHDSALRIHKS